MKAIELLELMTKRAGEYRLIAAESVNRNKHMNGLNGQCGLNQDQIDGLLADFINFAGMKCGVDYALYASDLAEQGRELV